MTTQEMTFDPGAVDTIDQESVAGSGPTHPIIQWHYGDPKAKKIGGMDYMGGWFIAADLVDSEVLTAAGWETTTYDHTGEASTDGFWRRELVISVLNMRKRWEVYGENSGMRGFPWDSYDEASKVGRAVSRLHVLCLIKGLEEQGPFVLTLKGTASMTFEGTRTTEGALAKFAQTVIRAANQASDAAAKKAGKPTGKRWPYRAFWLPVGAARDAEGNPVFVTVGKGRDTSDLVLPVALGIPATAADAADKLGRFYVGNELLATTNELWEESQAGWATAWDTAHSSAQGDGDGQESGEALAQADEAMLDDFGL